MHCGFHNCVGCEMGEGCYKRQKLRVVITEKAKLKYIRTFFVFGTGKIKISSLYCENELQKLKIVISNTEIGNCLGTLLDKNALAHAIKTILEE